MDPEILVDILKPALALVGAVGMTADDRAEWMIAAGSALAHLPEDLLRRGVKTAMRTADHPSKIVAAIIAGSQGEYDQRVRFQRDNAERDALVAGTVAMIEDYRNSRPTPEQVDAIMAEHGITSHKPKPIEPRVLRNPTVADYMELGLTTEQAQEAVKTLLPAPRQRDDGQIGKHLPEQRGDDSEQAA